MELGSSQHQLQGKEMEMSETGSGAWEKHCYFGRIREEW